MRLDLADKAINSRKLRESSSINVWGGGESRVLWHNDTGDLGTIETSGGPPKGTILVLTRGVSIRENLHKNSFRK